MQKHSRSIQPKLIYACLLVAFLVIGSLLTTSVQAGAEQRLAHDSNSEVEKPEVALISSSAETIELRAILPQACFGETTITGQRYLTLSGEGYEVTSEVGAPALPVLRQMIEVPLGAEVTLEMLETDLL